MNSTSTTALDISGPHHTIQAIDALACEGFGEIERIAICALASADSLPPDIYAALDSVCFLAQRVANDINCHAEAQGAACRLALG